MINLNDPYEIIKFIQNAKKTTPTKALVRVKNLEEDKIPSSIKFFGSNGSYTFIGEYSEIEKFIATLPNVLDKHIETDRRNSAIPLLDTTNINARIEPGVVIRDKVEIGDNAVLMMGAVINIGCEIGAGAMIDMNATLGGRAIVGKNAHIGAGAVLAGVIEPPSAQPVEVGEGALIGANAVVLEGVKVGAGAVVAAGSVVTRDVEANTVVAGIPARFIKKVADLDGDKNKIIEELRQL